MTRTYRKPSYIPQYLPAISVYPSCQKAAIYKGEVSRFLVNTSPQNEADFHSDVALLHHHLSKRGHTVPAAHAYDSERRQNLLSRLENRVSVRRVGVFSHTLILPYSRFIARLGIRDTIESSKLHYQCPILRDARVILAYTAGTSTFKQLYQLNFASGCGRAGPF